MKNLLILFAFLFLGCQSVPVNTPSEDCTQFEQEIEALKLVIENIPEPEDCPDCPEIPDCPTRQEVKEIKNQLGLKAFKLYECEVDLKLHSEVSIHNYYMSKDSIRNQRDYSISNLNQGYEDLKLCYILADRVQFDTFTRTTCYPIQLAIARDETRRDIFQLIMDNGFLPWVHTPNQ